MNTDRYTVQTLIIEILMIIAALIFIAPFYFIIVNSFKTYGEILTNSFSLPLKPTFDNYVTAWTQTQFPRVLLNSIIITVFSLAGMVFMGTAAAWKLVRIPNRASRIIFVLFVTAMVIPFQSIMIPLMKVVSVLGLFDSRIGLIIMYFGFGMPFTVFLFHGFVKGVPLELEEASIIAGAGDLRIYWSVVTPLLQPMIVTVIILQTLWIWNDFLLPLLVLTDKPLHTIPLAIYSFFGTYSDDWDKALATLMMGMIPIVAFFLSLQRYIIKGIVAGSLKG